LHDILDIYCWFFVCFNFLFGIYVFFSDIKSLTVIFCVCWSGVGGNPRHAPGQSILIGWVNLDDSFYGKGLALFIQTRDFGAL